MGNFSVILIIAVVILSCEINARPFLYSNNPEPPRLISHIADLRRPKLILLTKGPEYEQQNDINNAPSSNETQHNEATPGILQKKIAKILAKLQFFQKLSSDGQENISEFGFSVDDYDDDTTEVFLNVTANSKMSENIQVVSANNDEKPSFLISNIVSPILNLAYRIFSLAHPSKTK